MIEVRAIGVGYYNHILRKEGDEFEISDEKVFSKIWMERIHPLPEAQKPAKSEAKAKPVAAKGKHAKNVEAIAEDDDVL